MSTNNSTVAGGSTVTILNLVRVVGTALYVLGAVIAAIVTLVDIIQPDTQWGTLIAGTLAAVGFLIFAAVFWAVIGWFADTLTLLRKIAGVAGAAQNGGRQIV